MSDDPFFFLDAKRRSEEAIREAQEVIDQALGYIENQEDGPFTMWAALKEISERVDIIASEVNAMNLQGRSVTDVALKFREQRDRAIGQRDLLLLMLGPKFAARAKSKRKQ